MNLGQCVWTADWTINDVELPPTYAPDYKGEADLTVGSLCQGSFCI